MKKFTHPDFQTQLGKIIADIEQTSQIEVVVLIKERSAYYEDVPFSLGANLSMLTFSYFFLVDANFADYLVYLATLTSFGIGMVLGLISPLMSRLFVRKKRQQRQVEIMARALFQKGGLHRTRSEIGTLIYCSLLEKSIFIIADRGAQMALPEEEWQKITYILQSAFNAKNPSAAFLQALANCQETFKTYMPALENNINELPNDLRIEL